MLPVEIVCVHGNIFYSFYSCIILNSRDTNKKGKDTGKTRIIDIARKANVSIGTVDRVIHNRGEVSRITREKILSIIHELNYQPDILARTLAKKRVFNFAVFG